MLRVSFLALPLITWMVRGLLPCAYACISYRASRQSRRHTLRPVCVDTTHSGRPADLLPRSLLCAHGVPVYESIPSLAPPPAGGGAVAGCVSRAKNITDLTQYRKTHFSLANQGFHGKLSLSVDDNASCDNNTWHGNTFGTANQGCIQ